MSRIKPTWVQIKAKLVGFLGTFKGEVSPNNNVDWVSRKQFHKPWTVKVWADLDNQFKRSDYAKMCMSPSLDGTLPEYVISQEDNSPLTLYIDFSFFLSWISIALLIMFIHKCMHIHLSPNIPKYIRRGEIHFHEKSMFVFVFKCTIPLYSCSTVSCDITLKECHRRGRHTQNQWKLWKIISLDWIIQICPNFCCYYVSKIILLSHNLHKCLGKLP